jgi:serine/threonine protein kinase
VNDKHESSLTDFGVSRVLCASGFTSKNPSATLRNTAYELIGGREKQDEEEEQSVPPVTEATDVWAFAMTVLEVRIFASISLAALAKLTVIVDLDRNYAILALKTRCQRH